MKSKKSLWLVVVYIVAVFLPYLVPAFNNISPKLFSIPFTVWWTWLVVALFCICMFIWSKNGVFESYDNNGEDAETPDSPAEE